MTTSTRARTWDDVMSRVDDILVVATTHERTHDLDDGAAFVITYTGDEALFAVPTVRVTFHENHGWVSPKPSPLARYAVHANDRGDVEPDAFTVYGDWITLDDLPAAIAEAFTTMFGEWHVTPYSCDSCGRDAIDRHYVGSTFVGDTTACERCHDR